MSALTRRELALIVAFRAIYALLTVANHLFDAGGPGGPPGSTAGRVAVAVVESCCWALLTAPIFWLAGRPAVERSRVVPWSASRPASRVRRLFSVSRSARLGSSSCRS